MNFYQLDDVLMDKEFLKGNPVFCKAILSPTEYSSGKIKEGDRIVVLLTNGSKYMGKIVSFRYSLQNGYAIGNLEIIKAKQT